VNAKAHWLKREDHVAFDFQWMDDEEYRRDKILNELILDEARRTPLFQIKSISKQHYNINLCPSTCTNIQWRRKRCLNVTTAKHAKYYPITFVFRGIR
jgi:hypothetical protein